MEAHPGDVAAVWDIKLADGAHKIVFEHGTTSGKRVIIVDGVEVNHKKVMYFCNKILFLNSYSERTGCFD